MAVKFKVASAAERVKSQYEPYDGPDIRRNGVYRAQLKQVKYLKRNKGSYGFAIVAELLAAPGDPKNHQEFDGHPFFINQVITQTADGSPLKEGSQNTLDNFLYSIGAGANPEVICEDGDPDENPVVVKKIGKKNPVGAIVNLEVQMKMYNNELRAEVQSILPCEDKSESKKSSPALPKQKEIDDESDLMDVDEEIEENEDYEDRLEELKGMSIAALRKMAESEYDINLKGVKKADAIEAILEHEYTSDEAAALEEDDEEDEEDEYEEEDEDEDEYDEKARRKELKKLSRAALKKILLDLDEDARVKKSETEADLVNRIIDTEIGDDEDEDEDLDDEAPF